MHIQPVPFQRSTGPNGWALDLVPHPFVGMAAEALLGYLENPNAGRRMGEKGHPAAWRRRVGPFTVWAWADGSVAVKPLSGPPIPFPMWLHQHPTYPSHTPPQVPLDLDTGWLAHALLANGALLHGRRCAEVGTGDAFTEAIPLWWIPGGHPLARSDVWDGVLAHMAEVGAAWYAATGQQAPKAIGFSVMGGVLRADGTLDPARMITGQDPATGYINTRFADLLCGVVSVKQAWSAEHLLVDGHPDPNHRLYVPVLYPAPITAVTKAFPTPSAHLVFEVAAQLAAHTERGTAPCAR